MKQISFQSRKKKQWKKFQQPPNIRESTGFNFPIYGIKIVHIQNKIKHRKTNIMWYLSYVDSNFKNDADELIYKTETDSQILETNLWLLKGKHGGEG